MDLIFSTQEQNIRTRWLQLLIIQSTLGTLFTVYKGFYFVNINGSIPASMLLEHSLSIAFDLLVSYCMYYCGYKKQGTKLLSASIFFMCLNFILLGLLTLGMLISMALRKPIAFSLFSYSPSLTNDLFIVANKLLLFPFYWFTLQLKKINKASSSA